MNGTFYEQLGGVAGVFEQWGACERTVVACALTRRVPWPGLRLVQLTVEAALRNHADDERLQRDANNDKLLANLIALTADGDEDEATEQVRRLVSLVPLMRGDNERAKDVLVGGAPALVRRCVRASRGPRPPLGTPAGPDLARQLLSYLLVHPALTSHDHKTLTPWLRYLENHISGNRNTESMWQQRVEPCLVPDINIWSSSNSFRRTIGKNVEFRSFIDSIDHTYSTDLSQESFSKNGRDVDISLEEEKLNFDAAISQPKSQRSNSLTPPSTNFMQMSSSAENLCDESFVQKPRSFSLSSEHSLSQIRPISIMYGTTGSETRLDDLRSHNFTEHPGMSTVAQWLKSLRLHKYVWLFTNITYEQMISMDEKYLEKLGVTKGARHKLLLSIKKLGERHAAVEAGEAELRAGALGRGLARLRAVLLGPMPPAGPGGPAGPAPPAGDLPAAIVRALTLASKMVGALGEGARVPPLEELDPPVDPMSLHCWLVEKALHHESFSRPELQEALKRLRHRLPPGQFFHHVSDMPPTRRGAKPRWRVPVPPQARRHSHWAGAPPRGPAGPAGPRGPPRGPPLAPRRSVPCLTDDYSSLDALCLQMTEQAIN